MTLKISNIHQSTFLSKLNILLVINSLFIFALVIILFVDLVVIEEVLCQPLPEHPKRDNCFSLSTTSGDVFLLQADSLEERDAWIASIHAACALGLTSQPTLPAAMRVLRTEIGRLDQAVVHQRRCLDARQDGMPSQSPENSIGEWESLILTSFVLRSYLASMQQAELPNPKTLLALVSSQTKAVLRKNGAFTVSALHAIVSARGLVRSETLKQKAPIPPPSSESSEKQRLLHTPDTMEISQTQSSSTIKIPVKLPNGSPFTLEWPPSSSTSLASTTPVPKNVIAGVGVTHTKANNILRHICSVSNQASLSSSDHFLMARFKGEDSDRICERNEVLLLNVIESLIVEPKSVVRVDMSRSSQSEQFGIEVEAELDAEGCEQPQDELMRVFVSRVDSDARAAVSGL